jgi:SHS2 domain-containing protein
VRGRPAYSWVEHTAELELRIDAPTPHEVFVDAMQAFAELAGEGTGDRRSFEISLEAPDRASLLAHWLEELVFLAETEGFVPAEADLALDDTTLGAVVRGSIGDPPPLVKAVTYHGLVFEEEDGRWHARVVLDV